MSKMSDLLISIGGKLPETVKTNRAMARDAETEKLRQALLAGQITQQDMERQLQQQQLSKGDVELQKAQEDAQRERDARSKLGQTLNSFESQKQLAGTAQDLAGMEQAAGLTPLAEDESFKERSMRQVATESGLPQFAGQKDVQQFTADYLTKPEASEQRANEALAKIEQKDKELTAKQQMADERNKLNQDLLDQKLKAQASESEANRLAAEERARIAAEAKGNNIKPEEKASNANMVIDKINLLEKHPGFKSSVGLQGLSSLGGILKKPISGTDAAGFNAEFNSLKSLLTMDNIGKLKGVLSDSDMKILAQAATSLDTSMPEKDFKKELGRVRDVMTRVPQVGSTVSNITTQPTTKPKFRIVSVE